MKLLSLLNMWTSISLSELQQWIFRGESKLELVTLNFWNLIKIEPQKWQEKEYGDEGGGFWVVAIFGNKIVYFNDIEEGFNISLYKNFGEIMEYSCNQQELNWTIIELYNRIKKDID